MGRKGRKFGGERSSIWGKSKKCLRIFDLLVCLYEHREKDGLIFPLTEIKTEQILKPTATIHVGTKLSLIERKVFNTLIWHSQKHRFGQKADNLSLDLLLHLIGLGKSKNVAVIREALERLTTSPITWNTLNKDRSEEWGVCTFLAGGTISKGKVRYVLNPLLVEKINNPTLFAKIQLLVQTQFNSKYSLALYEFLLDEMGRSKGLQSLELKVPLETIRYVLQFDGAYKYLNSDVLRPCIKEINKHSDINVSFQTIKKGRSVAALKFIVEKTAFQIQMTFDDIKVMELEQKDAEASVKSELTLRLIEKGVSSRKAETLVKNYDAERIVANLELVTKEQKSGKIKNAAAYLVRAIEEDYRPKKNPEEIRKEQEQKALRKAEKAKQHQIALEKEWEEYRDKRLHEAFEAMPDTWKAAQQKKFIEKIEQEAKEDRGAVIYERYRASKFESAIVMANFLASLRDQLLNRPEEQSFKSYLEFRENDRTAAQ